MKITLDVRLLLVLIAVLAGLFVAQAQDTWQFIADRPVEIHAGRDLDSPLVRTLQAGEIISIRAPYVQADDLIWAEAVGVGYVALARFGYCEIRSFGTYQPADRAPISLGQ